MLNQLPEKLQSLLNNQSQNINLISSEFNSIEISQEQDTKFENIFLISTICLSAVLGCLMYINYNLNSQALEIYSNLSTKIDGLNEIGSSKQEINSKIEKLEFYKKTNEQRVKVASFFEYYSQVITFFQKDSIVSSKYSKMGNNINFEIIVNSSNTSLDQEINSYLKSLLLETSLNKVSELEVPGTNQRQFKFQGNYELR
jgi:hypothetical protein